MVRCPRVIDVEIVQEGFEGDVAHLRATMWKIMAPFAHLRRAKRRQGAPEGRRQFAVAP